MKEEFSRTARLQWIEEDQADRTKYKITELATNNPDDVGKYTVYCGSFSMKALSSTNWSVYFKIDIYNGSEVLEGGFSVANQGKNSSVYTAQLSVRDEGTGSAYADNVDLNFDQDYFFLFSIEKKTSTTFDMQAFIYDTPRMANILAETPVKTLVSASVGLDMQMIVQLEHQALTPGHVAYLDIGPVLDRQDCPYVPKMVMLSPSQGFNYSWPYKIYEDFDTSKFHWVTVGYNDFVEHIAIEEEKARTKVDDTEVVVVAAKTDLEQLIQDAIDMIQAAAEIGITLGAPQVSVALDIADRLLTSVFETWEEKNDLSNTNIFSEFTALAASLLTLGINITGIGTTLDTWSLVISLLEKLINGEAFEAVVYDAIIEFFAIRLKALLMTDVVQDKVVAGFTTVIGDILDRSILQGNSAIDDVLKKSIEYFYKNVRTVFTDGVIV